MTKFRFGMVASSTLTFFAIPPHGYTNHAIHDTPEVFQVSCMAGDESQYILQSTFYQPIPRLNTVKNADCKKTFIYNNSIHDILQI